MKHFLYFITSLLILNSCNPKEGYPEGRYFDYSGNDGCSPPNIGHRLGGDLEGFQDNSIEAMKHIATMQESRCFKHWEIDVAPTKDGLILRHDWLVGVIPIWYFKLNELPEGIVTLEAFKNEFHQLNLSKPLMIDLKGIPSKDDMIDLKQMALDTKNKHQIDVWFITDQFSALFLDGICEVMNNEVEVMLYMKGGSLC